MAHGSILSEESCAAEGEKDGFDETAVDGIGRVDLGAMGDVLERVSLMKALFKVIDLPSYEKMACMDVRCHRLFLCLPLCHTPPGAIQQIDA